MIRQLLPRLATVGVLHDPRSSAAEVQCMLADAAAAGVTVVVETASAPADVPPRLRNLIAAQVDAIVIPDDRLLMKRDVLAYLVQTTLGTRKPKPLVTHRLVAVRDGALLGIEVVPSAGGGPPRLAVNLRTAKVLGITPPQALVSQAVIVIR